MKLRTALEVLTNEDPRYKKKIDEAVKTLQQALMQHKKEWVGLTEDELEDLEFASVDREYGHLDVRVLSKAIEAKLKEKNNG